MTDLTTLTDAELDALPAAIEAERKRRAERDWERYRGMLEVALVVKRASHTPNTPLRPHDIRNIRALLAARNHDPDVVALVRLTRRWEATIGANDVLAPFASITDKD